MTGAVQAVGAIAPVRFPASPILENPFRLDRLERIARETLTALAATPIGDVGLKAIDGTVDGPIDWCVCLPAREEVVKIGASLDAILGSAKAAPGRGAVVVLVNGRDDGTAAIARRRLAGSSIPYAVAKVAFAPGRGGAPAARRVALDLAARLSPGGVLLTSDADSRVDAEWIAGNLALVAGGAGLVCGTIEPDANEHAALPCSVRACGALELAYGGVLMRLWREWAGPVDRPCGLRAHGASLAIAARIYTTVGRLPLPPAGEDRALAHLVADSGRSVVHPPAVRVTTSCRLDARARGGMGDALRDRSTAADPICDDTLVPLEILRRRARFWSSLPDGATARAIYREACRIRADLRAEPMRMSEVRSELDRARSWV